MTNTTDKQAELAIRLYELKMSYIDHEIEHLPSLKAHMLENKLDYTSEYALRSERLLQEEIECFEKVLGADHEKI